MTTPLLLKVHAQLEMRNMPHFVFKCRFDVMDASITPLPPQLCALFTIAAAKVARTYGTPLATWLLCCSAPVVALPLLIVNSCGARAPSILSTVFFCRTNTGVMLYRRANVCNSREFTCVRFFSKLFSTMDDSTRCYDLGNERCFKLCDS